MADQGLVFRPASHRGGGREAGLLVVALDLGTTYSGYAYSFKSDFLSDPLQVFSQNFVSANSQSDHGQRMTQKVPTAVLFTPDRKFHAFGFEAQDKFASLSRESRADARAWFYFETFKMVLHNNSTVTRDMPLLDFSHRKSMPALDVFSACIAFLRGHVTNTLRERRCAVRDEEISWVLTVPAIWDDQARHFMREAATKAGIPSSQLELALEPESASVFCQHYFPSLNASATSLDLTSEGQKFLVVDCGGGTIDLTVYEVMAGRRLRELYRPTGGAWGGTKVDAAFKAFLCQLAGFDAVAAFDRLEMLQLYRAFELLKRSPTFAARVSIRLPESVKRSLAENREAVERGQDRAGVELVRSQLNVDSGIVEDFFKEPCSAIVGDIENVLNQEATVGLETILLVGGFSESRLVQQAIRQAFPRYRVLVPDNPAAAVLKGAVIYRHRPDVIGWRASPFTYGISVTRLFRETEDLAEKLLEEDGTHYCRDVFAKFITVNQAVAVDQRFPVQSFNPLYQGQTRMVIEIFASRAESPRYTSSPGCHKVGEAVVHMADTSGDRGRQVHVTMVAGGTELRVEAQDGNSGQVFSTTVDFFPTS